MIRFHQFLFATILFAITYTFTQASDSQKPPTWDGVEIVKAAHPTKDSIAQINRYLKSLHIPVQMDEKGKVWVGHTHLTNPELMLKILNQTLIEEDIKKIRSIFTTERSHL